MACNKASLGELTAKFEKCAERQAANVGSQVKRRAAERDLLAVAEVVRDMCIKAVKGNKETLAAVFGGTCEELCRLYQVLDTIELSEMHAGDNRWEGCRQQLDVIKQILLDLGSFKPYSIGKQVPICEYQVNKRYSPGERVQIAPTLKGQHPTYFSVSPELPASIRLNTSSGLISGQLRPGVEVDGMKYIVTAGNAHGQTEVEISFAVKVPPPESIEYPGMPRELFACEVIGFEPEVHGGFAEAWSVEPPLPSGLRLDVETGAITGSPSEAIKSADYVITANNTSGTASLTLQIGVVIPPPVSLAYPSAQEEYPCSSVVYIIPDVTMARSGCTVPEHLFRTRRRLSSMLLPDVNFVVEPELPEGMQIADKVGVITGRPTKPTPRTVYRITARNGGGEVVAELPLTIKLAPPEELSFPDVSEDFYVGEPIQLSPEVEGTVSEWRLEPALPAGLVFDASMGIIEGIPTEEAHCCVTVTAKNEEGETSCEVEFNVRRPPPSQLEYPVLENVYALHRPLVMNPTVHGLVENFTVEPALPAGIELNAESGVVQGAPTAISEETTYEITARNCTGATTAKITFAIAVMPPTELTYQSIDDLYYFGEKVEVYPSVVGGATTWTVEPALPEGLALDGETGMISGAPVITAETASYTVTASNEAGGTSTVLSFMVTAPAPEGLSYPSASDVYMTLSTMTIEPELESGVCGTFTIEPALPDGVAIQSKTGIISGAPSKPLESTTFTVTVTNIAGTTSVDITFSVAEMPNLADATETFANLIERVTDIAELQKMDPSKKRASGDWMLWMVHRAWLNDPDLTIFDFSNLAMPLAHREPRIAPKLMKAIGHNTVITQLHLNNTNLQKRQGHELAESLRKNKTLLILTIETNNLDSSAVEACARALAESPESNLQQWRFNDQRGCGKMFGRPVEQALADLMETNHKIIKLGVTMNDAHWRRCIDRCLVRNNDVFRRWRKHPDGRRTAQAPEPILAVDRVLSKLILDVVPDKAAWEIFDDDNEKLSMVRKSVVTSKAVPTKEQLQSFAKAAGTPLKFSEVAPLLKEFRTKLLNAILEIQVAAIDVYNSKIEGTLSAWTEANEKWLLDIWPTRASRFAFKADKTPSIVVTDQFAEWLMRRA